MQALSIRFAKLPESSKTFDTKYAHLANEFTYNTSEIITEFMNGGAHLH